MGMAQPAGAASFLAGDEAIETSAAQPNFITQPDPRLTTAATSFVPITASASA